MPHQQMTFDLLQRIQSDAHNYQEAGPSEEACQVIIYPGSLHQYVGENGH
ncbi:unnamed protein product, partial [marine sediment metagenome]